MGVGWGSPGSGATETGLVLGVLALRPHATSHSFVGDFWTPLACCKLYEGSYLHAYFLQGAHRLPARWRVKRRCGGSGKPRAWSGQRGAEQSGIGRICGFSCAASPRSQATCRKEASRRAFPGEVGTWSGSRGELGAVQASSSTPRDKGKGACQPPFPFTHFFCFKTECCHLTPRGLGFPGSRMGAMT